MPIELTRRDFRMKLTGADTFTVAAGKKLSIETSPRGEEMLSETVPQGKVWEVQIVVDIIETDA